MDKRTYQIEKACHLGRQGETVEMTERAAAHLMAAGLLAPARQETEVKQDKREKGSRK